MYLDCPFLLRAVAVVRQSLEEGKEGEVGVGVGVGVVVSLNVSVSVRVGVVVGVGVLVPPTIYTFPRSERFLPNSKDHRSGNMQTAQGIRQLTQRISPAFALLYVALQGCVHKCEVKYQ